MLGCILNKQKIEIDLGNVKLQNRVLLVLSMLLSIAAIAAGLFNIYLGNKQINIVIAAEFLASFIFAFVAINTFRNRKKSWYPPLVIYTFFALISFALFKFPAGSTIIQWWYVIPLLCLFLLNKWHGTLISLAMLVIAVYVHICNNINELERAWAAGLVNLTLPYLIILALANVYERVRKQNESELTEFALTDPLTNCYNRLALKFMFPRFQNIEQDYSVLMVDIDNFKFINDKYGHEAGDQALIEIGRLFTDELAPGRVFRVGGEEFLLLLEGTDEEGLIRAESIRAKVERAEFSYGGNLIYLTISAGLVRGIKQLEMSDIVKKADKLLYTAKEKGRNRVIY